VLFESVRLHGDARWSNGEPIQEAFVNPMTADGSQLVWAMANLSNTGKNGAFDLLTTPEAALLEVRGPGEQVLRHELRDLEPGEDRELHLVFELSTDAVFVYFADQAGQPLPPLLKSSSWEELQRHPLIDAELRLQRPSEPSILPRVQKARTNPEVVHIGDDRPVFLELLRNGEPLAEGVWLEQAGSVTLVVGPRNGTPRKLRVSFPDEFEGNHRFYYRVGSLGDYRGVANTLRRNSVLDLGVQEAGTLFVYLSTVEIGDPKCGLAHRLPVTLFEEGDPASIAVVPHPLVEVDTTKIPDAFRRGDGELEILDGVGEVVWRGRLDDTFELRARHPLPLPPGGSIRVRRGAEVYRLH